jgi:uncharacterized protein
MLGSLSRQAYAPPMRYSSVWIAGLLLATLGTAPGAAPTSATASQTPTALQQALRLYNQGDWSAAQAAFERLSALDVPAADYNLAVMHLRKELPQPSMTEAVRLMTRAAERGFVTAMAGLAQLHERGDVSGRRDLAAAHQWHLKAAEAGSVDAQVETATGFYLGRGAAKEMGLAAQWYRQAAKGGDAGAQYLIASMYEHGLGVPRDLRLARYWYEQCARAGDVAAPGKVREIDAKLTEAAAD